MNRRTKYGIYLLLVLVSALSIYGLFFRNSSRHLLSPPDAILSAAALTDAYDNGEGHADSLYLYKTLVVGGIVDKFQKNGSGRYVVTLAGHYPGRTAVDCILDSLYIPAPNELRTGDTVTIRGRCAGESLNVIIVQCIIEK